MGKQESSDGAGNRVPLSPDGIRKRPKAVDLFCGAGGAGTGLHRAGFDVTGIDIVDQPNYPFEFVKMSALDVDVNDYDFVWGSPPCFLFTGIIPAAQREKHGASWDHPNLIPDVRRMAVEAGKPYIIENVAGAVKELIDPVKLCGTMFDLKVFRHRLFESNMPLCVTRRCDHRNRGLGIHAPKYKKPPAGAALPDDWVVEERVRKQGSSAGHVDRYYRSPGGRLFRSFYSAYHVATHSYMPEEFEQFFPVYGMPGQRGSMEQWKEAMGIDWMERPKSLALAIPPAYSEYLGRQMLYMMGYQLDYDPVGYEAQPGDIA